MYQRLDGARWRHIYIVGDLHGCLQQLAAALRRQHFNPWQDAVISVGDVIDRGPDSLGCLRLLEKAWFFAVCGNHEAMAVSAIAQGNAMLWQCNGGDWYGRLTEAEQQETQRLLQRAAHLPLVIELHSGTRTIVVAHADYPAESYCWQQPLDAHQIVWSRERINRLMPHPGEGINGADAFYFGHTPLKSVLESGNLHYIDTGAVFGNQLTLVQVQ